MIINKNSGSGLLSNAYEALASVQYPTEQSEKSRINPVQIYVIAAKQLKYTKNGDKKLTFLRSCSVGRSTILPPTLGFDCVGSEVGGEDDDKKKNGKECSFLMDGGFLLFSGNLMNWER